MMKTSETDQTSTMLRRLFRTADLNRFISHYADDMNLPPFHVYISQLCRESGLVPEQIIRQAGIDRTYGHQLFNGRRRPSRDKVIQFAFGLRLDVDGAQKLLRIAQKVDLYPRVKRDAVFLFCLNHGKDIIEAQSLLLSLGLPLLGGEEQNG